MNCRELSDFICDYLSGELPGEQKSVFERHLACCPDCVHYLDSYRQTIALARSALSAAEPIRSCGAPEGLIQAILAAKRASN